MNKYLNKVCDFNDVIIVEDQLEFSIKLVNVTFVSNQ